MVNSTTGSGMLIKSREMAKVLEEGLFEKIWSSGLDVKHLLPIANLRGGDDAFDYLIEINYIGSSFRLSQISLITMFY